MEITPRRSIGEGHTMFCIATRSLYLRPTTLTNMRSMVDRDTSSPITPRDTLRDIPDCDPLFCDVLFQCSCPSRSLFVPFLFHSIHVQPLYPCRYIITQAYV